MTDKIWLSVLEQATSYRDLQNVFSQMLAEANSTSDAQGMAVSIDDAIGRIEQEIARDNSELASISSGYDAFKSEQAGMLGWIKRKLPFTETRKQELKHRGSVEDQKAEVLADNFIIARAHMLRERIAPSSIRRMGLRTQEWREKLGRHESILGIRDYGITVNDLGQELPSARFLAEKIRAEIDAFSGANFTDKQDRSLRDSDLVIANSEVKVLEDEVHDKDRLRKSALIRLAALVQEELSTEDPAFRTLTVHTDQLQGTIEHFAKVKNYIEELRGHLETGCARLTELQAIPSQRDSLAERLHKLASEFKDVESKLTTAVDALREPSRLFVTATRNVGNAKTALDAAKPIYDAYQSEQSRRRQSNAEVSSEFDFDETSPVVAEFGRLKSALSQAEVELHRITPTHENAKRAVEQITQQSNSLKKKIDEANSDLSKLDDQRDQLTKKIVSARENVSRIDFPLRSALQMHAGNLQSLHWMENSKLLAGVPHDALRSVSNSDILPDLLPWSRTSPSHLKSRELVAFQEQLESNSKFEKHLHSDKSILDKELTILVSSRQKALKQRGQLLFPSSLVDELRFE